MTYGKENDSNGLHLQRTLHLRERERQLLHLDADVAECLNLLFLFLGSLWQREARVWLVATQ